MIQDHYLKAADESALYLALQLAGLATVDPLGRSVAVTDDRLIAALDAQPVNPDLICTYQGGTYAARAGQWFELLPSLITQHPNLDIIGPIPVDTGEKFIDADGNEQPVMASQPGFFANLYAVELTDEQIAVLPVTAEPRTKYRVLA